MKTFKQYILLEDKVNYKKYGSWINAKTREVIGVDSFQHEEEMYTWVADQPEGKLKNPPRSTLETMDEHLGANEDYPFGIIFETTNEELLNA